MARQTAVIGPDKIREDRGALVLDVPYTVASDSLRYNRPREIKSGAFVFVTDEFKETVLKARESGQSLRVIYDVGAPDELVSVVVV